MVLSRRRSQAIHPGDLADLDRLVRTARRAALSAGGDLARGLGRSVSAVRAHDLGVEADQMAHERIAAVLAGTGLPVLSEEAAGRAPGPEANGLRWVVDPLDGSVNYACRIPLACVSIGLMSGTAPLAGVVYDFSRGEMYVGVVGLGATLNGRRIAVASRARMAADAVLCTGFPAGSDFSDASARGFARDLQRYRKVRLLGSAALSLAYVAAGRADAYHESGIALWDVAAGLALVLAAGGAVCCVPSQNPDRVDAAAAASTRLLRPGLRRTKTAG